MYILEQTYDLKFRYEKKCFYVVTIVYIEQNGSMLYTIIQRQLNVNFMALDPLDVKFMALDPLNTKFMALDTLGVKFIISFNSESQKTPFVAHIFNLELGLLRSQTNC